MAFITFKLVNKEWFAMPEAERVPELERRAKAQEEVLRNGGWSQDQRQANPFPSWVKKIIKRKLGGEARYDPDNETYSLTVPGGMDDADDAMARFEKLYKRAAQKSEERTRWFADHHVQMSVSTAEDSEDVLLADLAAHLEGRNRENRPTIVKPQEEVAVAGDNEDGIDQEDANG